MKGVGVQLKSGQSGWDLSFVIMIYLLLEALSRGRRALVCGEQLNSRTAGLAVLGVNSHAWFRTEGLSNALWPFRESVHVRQQHLVQ